MCREQRIVLQPKKTVLLPVLYYNNELKWNSFSFVASVFMFSISIAMFYSCPSFISNTTLQRHDTFYICFSSNKAKRGIMSLYSFRNSVSRNRSILISLDILVRKQTNFTSYQEIKCKLLVDNCSIRFMFRFFRTL